MHAAGEVRAELIGQLSRNGRFKRPKHLSMFNLRLKPSTNHFQQITTIAQRNHQKLRQVRKHHCVAGDLGSERDVFQYLSHHTDAVISGCVQDVQRGLGIDEERGRRAVDAGDGDVSLHGIAPIRLKG